MRGVWLLCRFDRVRRKYRLHFKNKKHPQERTQQTELRDMQGFGIQTDLQTGLPVLCSDEDNVVLHEHEESKANPDRLLLTGVLGNGNVSLVKSVIRFLNHKLKSL